MPMRRWYQVGRKELRTQGSPLSAARQWKGNTSEGRGVLEKRTQGEERFQQWLPAASSKRKTENGFSLLVINDFRKISFRERWFPTRSDFVTHRMFGNIWRHFWLARPGCREEILSSCRLCPGMLLNILQCKILPPKQRINQPQILIVQRMRNW